MACSGCDQTCIRLLFSILFCVGLVVSKSILTKTPENLDGDSTTIPEVTIPQGRLLGLNLVTHHGRNIFGFKSIPFAEPPVGNLRFKAPVPPRAWNGTLDASRDSNKCPQTGRLGTEVNGDEDCLHLNIYTPRELLNRLVQRIACRSGQLQTIPKTAEDSQQVLGITTISSTDWLFRKLSGVGRIKINYTCFDTKLNNTIFPGILATQLPTSENFTPVPVLLFIHGGAFKGGNNDANSFGPQFLLDKDVVLVVPRYRVGLLGFLSTGDEVAPGNWGLKDLVRALEWNRDNIKYFGGDPDQTTIFGQSAGSISVHLLSLSSSTNGLFHRYITDSGTALSFDGYRPREALASRTIQLGEYFGCPTTTSINLVECLRTVNTSQLLSTDSLFNVWGEFPVVVWSPTTEPDVEGAFLTESPANLVNDGKIRDLPWLSSINRDEGILYAAGFYKHPDLFENFLNNLDVALPPMLTYDTEVGNVTAYTEALKSYYFNDLTADRDLLLRNLTQLVGDGLFAYPAYSANEKQLAYMKAPQFLCSFEYRGTFSSSYSFSGGDNKDHGVSHSDELLYLFQSSLARRGPSGTKMSENDWKMVDTMVQLWTSFAISGTPTFADPNNNVTWERFSSRKNYLRIGNNSDISIGVEYNYLEDRMQFWDELTAATSWK